MKDEQIIALYFARDEDAITETKNAYGKRLLSLARHILSSAEDAEEAESETYFAAWRSIPPTCPQFFFAWLAKACRLLSLKKVDRQQARKRSAEVVELSDELSACLPDHRSIDEAGRVETLQVIGQYLKRQTPQKRRMFMRRYWYMDTVEEIARAQKVGKGKVKTDLYRMRQELKRELSWGE